MADPYANVAGPFLGDIMKQRDRDVSSHITVEHSAASESLMNALSTAPASMYSREKTVMIFDRLQ